MAGSGEWGRLLLLLPLPLLFLLLYFELRPNTYTQSS